MPTKKKVVTEEEAKDVMEKMVEVAKDEWAKVQHKVPQKKMTVNDLIAQLESYRSICECTNVAAVHRDGEVLVLS